MFLVAQSAVGVGVLTRVLAIVVALSLLLNAALGVAALRLRDTATRAVAETKAVLEQRDGALSMATECSTRVDQLQGLAATRAREAETRRAAAASTARAHAKRADYTLSLRPRDPHNLCGSMQALGDEWLQGRAKP